MVGWLKLLLVIQVCQVGTVLACSCAQGEKDHNRAVLQAYKGAALVVVAQATAIEKRMIKKAWMEKEHQGEEGQITRFTLLDVFKGEAEDSILTKSLKSNASCDLFFEQGTAYLLYLYGPDQEGYYSTTICNRSIKLEGAKQDLEVLKQLRSQ